MEYTSAPVSRDPQMLVIASGISRCIAPLPHNIGPENGDPSFSADFQEFFCWARTAFSRMEFPNTLSTVRGASPPALTRIFPCER